MTTMAENENGNKPRLESVWLTSKDSSHPRGGKKPGLTRPQVISAAIRVLDDEGLAALSMRRLAADLEIAPMSLYWHVPTKDALLEFALDEALGRLDLELDENEEWGQRVERIAYDLRQIIREHPWMSKLTGVYATVGPNALAMFEALIRMVEKGGFRAPAAYRAVGTLVNYVFGFAADEAKWLIRMNETELDPEAIKDIWLPPMLELARDRYPRMYANLEAGETRDWDDQFSFGLSCMVDGMRARTRNN